MAVRSPFGSRWPNHRGKYRGSGSMCPANLAARHPATNIFFDYATGGCPVKTGQPWTIDQITAAIDRGPHLPALTPEAIEHAGKEVEDKVQQGHAEWWI